MQHALLVAPSRFLSDAMETSAARGGVSVLTVPDYADALKRWTESGAGRVVIDATTDRTRAYELVAAIRRQARTHPTIVLVGTERDEEAFAMHARLRSRADVYVFDRADAATILEERLVARVPQGPTSFEFLSGILGVLAVAAATLLRSSNAWGATWLLVVGAVAYWVSTLFRIRRIRSVRARVLTGGSVVAVTAVLLWVFVR